MDITKYQLVNRIKIKIKKELVQYIEYRLVSEKKKEIKENNKK